MKKRILAWCMAVTVTLTAVGSDVSVYAKQTGDVTELSENEGVETTEVTEETETSGDDGTESVEETEVSEAVAEEETEVSETVTEDVTEDTLEGTTADVETIDVDVSNGYISLPIEDEIGTLAEDDVEAYQSSLPSSYITPNLPSIRDQNPYGTCWAFSATSLAELSILQNESADASSIDFSELHLAYFTNYSVTDPLGGTSGDSNTFANSTTNFLKLGGNLMFAMYALAGWTGAADETTAPYETASTVATSGLSSSLAYEDVAHMKNAYIINIAEDPEAAKALIKELGGIGISYNASSFQYYNSTYNSYYNPNTVSTNHAVTVVGWNDDFPKENFTNTPAGDGAWLVRNSWGVDDYSYYGYFWMSYYEGSLSEAAYAFDFVSSDSDEYYDNNYQYDGSELTAYLYSTNSFANVFTVQGASEVLKAVSFDTGTTSETYTIQIYKNLINTSNPESGTLVDTVTGTTTYQGIYSVVLSKDIYLNKGDNYAVVVTLKRTDESPSIAYEYSAEISAQVNNTTVPWITCMASSSSGQSFYKSGTSWVDYGASGNGNFRIKAYTNNVSGSTAVTGVSVAADTTTIGVGGTTTVTATVAPSNATNQNVTWSSSNTSVATVAQNGVVTGVAGGTAKITAKTSDGGYTASVTITVDNKILTGISLSKTSASLEKGGSLQLSVSYTPSNTTSDKTVTWSSSNTKVAKVSSKGVVTAIGYGTAAITATVGSCTATCTVTVNINTMKCVPIANSDGSVTISWDAVDGVTGYYVYRNGDCAKLIKDATTVTYTDTAANAGKTSYYYGVSAYYKGTGSTIYSGYYKVYVRYPVKYSLKGGTNSSDNPTYFTANNIGTKYTLADPTRKGYTFAGWYSDSSYKNKITSLTAKRKIVTVYAKWTEHKYTISFQGNGSSSGSMSKMTKLKYSKSYTLTKNAFKKKGYKFTGWNTKADGSGKTYKNAASVSKLTTKDGKTVKLYAQWKKVSYTITYKLNGGKNNSKNPAKYNVKTETIKLKKPTRKGYTFVGWYSDKSCKKKVTQIKKGSTGNKTLYAKWKKK